MIENQGSVIMKIYRSGISLTRWLILFILTFAGCSENPDTPGSANKANWKVIGPGGGGSTFIPTFDPNNPDRILIRCDMSGAYLTEDGGRSWEMLNFPGGAQAFAFDPGDSNNIYVGAAGLNGTRDGGKTWSLLFPPQNQVEGMRYINDHASSSYVLKPDSGYPSRGTYVAAILVDPADSKHLIIGVNGRTDNGRIYGVS